MRLTRNISVLGTRPDPCQDPMNYTTRLDTERAMARLDNRKCDICGAVGAECNKHKPKQERPKEVKVIVGNCMYIHEA